MTEVTDSNGFDRDRLNGLWFEGVIATGVRDGLKPVRAWRRFPCLSGLPLGVASGQSVGYMRLGFSTLSSLAQIVRLRCRVAGRLAIFAWKSCSH